MTRPASIPADLWDQIPTYLRPAIAAVVVGLETQIATLTTQVATVTARVAQLEAQLNQNSSNSSKPPSSDGPHVKPAPAQTPSTRKRGGQPGHPKHERILLPPDQIIEHKPAQCPACQASLTGDDPEPIVDQVVELPTQLRHVTHHRRHTLTCPCCRVPTTTAPVPDTRAGFGPRLVAVTAYLSGVGRLGKRTIRTLFADVFGIPVSLGVVSKHEAVVSRALEPIHTEAHTHVQGLDANVDETGWKQGRTKAWLWVAVTNRLSVFLIRPKRNRAAFDDLVGPNPGVLTTDRYPVYTHLGDQRQVCWAHLRRDFQAMIDRKNGGSVIGQELLAQADLLFVHWQKVRDGTGTHRWFHRAHSEQLRSVVRVLLERGTVCPCAKTQSVCRELLAVESSLWTFAGRGGVEPTNNAAERAVRHAVCWRKTSYGTDSERGSRFVERVLTVVASCRQQGRGVLDFLVQALAASVKPSLLPANP